MRFTETQKRKLIKMINEKIINHPEKVKCFCDHQFLNDQFVFKFSDDHHDIDIIVHQYSNFHRDVEIDIHDKISKTSLIFDSHQYFWNPKDIRIMIKLLIDIVLANKPSNDDVKEANLILNDNE